MIIDHELKELIPPLAQDEYQGLENSLLSEGCRDNLIVWKEEDILLDGHNRYEICQKHNLTFQIKYVSFPDRAAAKIWIIRNQLDRRNITAYQRSELVLILEPMIREKAKENQQLSQGRGQKGLQNSANLNSIDTREELAKAAGVSHDTIHKVKTIQECGIEPLKDMVRSGEISINAASTISKASEEEQIEMLSLPHKEMLAKAQELAAKCKAEAEAEKKARLAAEQREASRQQTITTLEEQIKALENERTRLRAEHNRAILTKQADDACIIRQQEFGEEKERQIEELTRQIEKLKAKAAQPQVIEKEVKVEVEKRIEVIPEDYDVLKVEVNTLKEKLETTFKELDKVTKKLSKKEELLSLFGNEQKQARGLQKVSDGMKYIEEAYLLLKDQCLDECVRGIVEGGLQSLNRLFHNLFEGNQHEQD